MTEARELYLKMFSTVLMLFSRLLRATRPSVPITRSRPLNTAHTAAAMSQLFIRTLTGKNFQFDDLDFDTVTIGDLKRQVSEGAATATFRDDVRQGRLACCCLAAVRQSPGGHVLDTRVYTHVRVHVRVRVHVHVRVLALALASGRSRRAMPRTQRTGWLSCCKAPSCCA